MSVERERAQERSRALRRRYEGARTCGGPNRPAPVCSVHHTCGRPPPSRHDVLGAGGRHRWGPGGAERAQERSRALRRSRQGARTWGGPDRPEERVCSVGWSRCIGGTQGGVFRVQRLSRSQHWLVQLVVICSSFPRSVPRAAAPGGPPEGTPHPMTSARLIVQRLFQFVANRSHARSIEQSGLEASSVNLNPHARHCTVPTSGYLCSELRYEVNVSNVPSSLF